MLVTGCYSFKQSGKVPSWNPPTDYHLKNTRISAKQFVVVQRYAPILMQRTHADTRINFLTDYRFDGDDNTANNYEHLYFEGKDAFKLPAILYYALVETKTHYFITYMSYHAYDEVQSGWTLIFHWTRMGGSHENDAENIQLVIQKSTRTEKERLVLIANQNHTRYEFCAVPELLDSKSKFLKWPGYRTFDPDIINDRITFYLESGKHAIYQHRFYKANSRTLRFYPLPDNKPQYWSKNQTSFAYQLKPIRTELWTPYIANKHLGQAGAMNGTFNIALKRNNNVIVNYTNLPRHFNSDKISICLVKKNSGIMPFYFGKGNLFFDPAYHYRKSLKSSLDEEDWSTAYIYNPYIDITKFNADINVE
ncbi:hypothetical protein JYT61_00580 [bacterium AH-315-E10]|nr:hypothetical protein [bacterium AH-315-E10]